jgi:predicted AAA+ superfamily ATPase
MPMIPRSSHVAAIRGLLRRHPVVAILGARQVGKSTLARLVARSSTTTFFDLEDDSHLARLADPLLALSSLRGLVVLDEVQRRPDLFPALRVLADRPRHSCRFLVLGKGTDDAISSSE